MKEIRSANPPRRSWPSVRSLAFWQANLCMMKSAVRIAKLFLNEWHWKWFNEVRTRAIFYFAEISCDVTLLKRSIFNVRNDLCLNPSYIGFSDDDFLFTERRKSFLTLTSFHLCFARTLYNEEKKYNIEGGGIVPIRTINNLFSIASQRTGAIVCEFPTILSFERNQQKNHWESRSCACSFLSRSFDPDSVDMAFGSSFCHILVSLWWSLLVFPFRIAS